MRRHTGAALGLALLVGACSTATPAPPTTQTITVTQTVTPTPTATRNENAFRVALASYDVDMPTALAIAHTMCDALDQGKTVQQASDSVQTAVAGLNKPFNPALPQALGRATRELCPSSVP